MVLFENYVSLHRELITKKFVTKKYVIRKTLSNTAKAVRGDHRTSTIYSALKRLQKDGYVIYTDCYEMEDPFFSEWIAVNNG